MAGNAMLGLIFGMILTAILVLKVTKNYTPKPLANYCIIGGFAAYVLGAFIGSFAAIVFSIFAFIAGAGLVMGLWFELVGGLNELKNAGAAFSAQNMAGGQAPPPPQQPPQQAYQQPPQQGYQQPPQQGGGYRQQ